MKERILSFFKGASSDYADAPRLSGAAKKYYRTYKKLFDSFAEGNYQGNAYGMVDTNKNAVTNMNTENMQVTGENFKWFAIESINKTVDKAISNKGNIEEKYNQKQISKVPHNVASIVSTASNGKIDISGKYIAVNGDNIWHEYQSHSNLEKEKSIGQIPLTPKIMKDAIAAIYDPDMVESIFADTSNPTQRQSFAYAKKSPDGHYIVVEAVGGKNNPNIVPVMVLQFSETKWNAMMSSGKTLGELFFENDSKKKNALDIAFNKNNRVIVAQFASKEAIASTPHSPRFNNSIPQNPEKVNRNSEKTDKSFALPESDQKILFDSFTEGNYQGNAYGMVDTNKNAVTNMNTENMQVTGGENVRFALKEYTDTYTEEETASIKRDEKNMVAKPYEDVLSFVSDSINGKSSNRLFVGKIKTQTAAKIKSEADVYTFGKSVVLSSDDIRHVFSHHGDVASEALRGQEAITVDNFADVMETIFDPDTVNAERDKSGTVSLIFEKERHGRVTAVTIVSEKKKALTLKTARITKKKQHISSSSDVQAPNPTPKAVRSMNAVSDKGSKGQLLNMEENSSPQPTSKTSFDGNATNNRIPQKTEKVNRKSEKTDKSFALPDNDVSHEARETEKKRNFNYSEGQEAKRTANENAKKYFIFYPPSASRSFKSALFSMRDT